MDDSALSAISLPLDGQGQELPFAGQAVVLSRLDYIELKAQLNFYKTQHERALVREAALQKELEQVKAKIRDLNQRLYGRKSNQSAKLPVVLP